MAFTTEEEAQIREWLKANESAQGINDLEKSDSKTDGKEVIVYEEADGSSKQMKVSDIVNGSVDAVASTDHVEELPDDSSVVVEKEGKTQRVLMSNFKTNNKASASSDGFMSKEDKAKLDCMGDTPLSDYAFYMDINIPSAKGADRIDVGGSDLMRQTWLNQFHCALMDKDGHYTLLNDNDHRYTADGVKVCEVTKDTANKKITYAITEGFENAQWMHIGPDSYIYADKNTAGRVWLSLVPIPGGRHIGRTVAGMFMINVANGKGYSKPGVQPSSDNYNVMTFFNAAQAYGKNYGLAGRANLGNELLFYMFAKYGWRDSQNCATSDGTKVWGVGLDGTETTSQSDSWQRFLRQRTILTGSTLALGINDGNTEVWDSDGNVCHSVNVGGVRDPWGQYWEDDGHSCSVSTTVYNWLGNFMPTGTPTADSFAGVEHFTFNRPTANNAFNMKMSIDASTQRVILYPTQYQGNLSYGDYYWYADVGQLWCAGGSSFNGSDCGLGCASSNSVWSYSYLVVSARLDFHGDIQQVSTAKLKEYLAAA